MPPATAVDPNTSPILLIPYQWIGDFVRCHSVVEVLRARFPGRPIDMLTSTLCAPLLDYMPGVRAGVQVDLPRGRLAFRHHKALAARLRERGYGTALVMPRTWKSALAPALARIPERIGFLGEMRFGVLTDLRGEEKQLPRMIDQCGALALPADAPIPADWPLPRLAVPLEEAEGWRHRTGLPADGRPVVVLAPGAVGPSKRWSYFAEAATALCREGMQVWVVGGPGERDVAQAICAAAGPLARDLTSTDLRNAVLALRLADVAVSNDSGLLHVAAAIGTASIGLFGPTSPWHWAPLNPLAAILQRDDNLPCQPCHKPTCQVLHHRCMTEIPADRVIAAVREAIAEPARRVSARR